MSYILDALTQADRRRNGAQVPTIRSVHQTSVGTNAATVRWRLVLLLVGIIALTLLCYAMLRGAAPFVAATAPEIAAPPASDSLGSKPATELNRAQIQVPPKVKIESLAHISRPLHNAQPARFARSGPTLSDAARRQGQRPDPEATTLPHSAAQPRDVVRAAPRLPGPAASAQHLDRAQQQETIATVTRGPGEAIPLLEELPPGFRNSLPRLDVNAHVYSEAPAARMVIINMRRYREGDNTAEGLTIEKISEDGVTLAYAEHTFRLRR